MKYVLIRRTIFFVLCISSLQAAQSDILTTIKRDKSMVVSLTKEMPQSSKPTIIKAFATWCHYCSRMQPIFEQVEKEVGQKYTFAEFDIEKAPELTKQLAVQSLPTFIFIKNNKEVGREVGAMSAESLKKLITKYLG